MKRYTPDELAEVLRLHRLWLNNEEGGSRANLRDADLRGANLYDANLRASLVRVFSGLYIYQCWAIVSDKGIPWVRMGCKWKTVEEWDSIGVRNSNPGEFPNDGSEESERRVRAFEFTRAEALLMAAKFKEKVA